MADRNMLSAGRVLSLALAIAVVGTVFVAISGDAAATTFPAGPFLLSSSEPDWPQWRGPRRDAISGETGLLDAWPEGGPKLLWKTTGMGKGWCSPIVVGERMYIVGDVGGELKIFAMGLDGKVKWRVTNGKAWKKPFPGGRGSCCYSDGKIYQINGFGRLVCLDATDGKELWTVNILERFDAKQPFFGVSECLLIDGDNVIVTPAGKKAIIAALDKKTGKTVWAGKARPEDTETAGYSAPILVYWGRRKRILIASTSFRTFAADARTGKVLWTAKLPLTKNACSTIPVLCGDSVFITSTSIKEQFSSMLRISSGADKVSKTWTEQFRTTCGSSVQVAGDLYMASERGVKGFLRIDAKTGKVKAKLPDPIDASMVWADGKLFVLSATGKAMLLKTTSDGFKELGSFAIVEGKKKDAWTHPVLLNGRLYLRYHDTLFCYDVKGK